MSANTDDTLPAAAQTHPVPPTAAASRPVSVYAAIGATLTNHVIDPDTGGLSPRGSITLPSRLQYAWPHGTLPILYAGCADRGATGGAHPFNLCALLRDGDGNLSLHGSPAPLPARPIHLTVDTPNRHVLVAYSGAPGLTVHRLHPDGTIGAEIPPSDDFEFGSKPHQIRALPGCGDAILVSRGVKGFGKSSYIAGAFNTVRFDGEAIENIASHAPNDAQAPRGFNPRGIDFHPTLPLVFATLEGQNELAVFALGKDGIDPAPLFSHTILQHPHALYKSQDGGEVHVHPAGTHVYVANRNDSALGGSDGPAWLTPDPIATFAGGENSVAVFRLNPDTGEPTLVQHVDTRGLHARTIALDKAGRFLVAANIAPMLVEENGTQREVPASLSIFRIGADGLLTFLHKVDVDVAPEKLWWMGIPG